MAVLGNILWFIFGGGILLGTLWVLTGALWCITIIGIPIGVACFRIAAFSYFPFGKQLVPAEMVGEKAVFGSGFMNVIWCIFCGFWLALFHISVGVTECLGIITIPFGLANFKIAVACFAPLGKRIVSSEDLMNRCRYPQPMPCNPPPPRQY
ncbi:MAG: YccF family protein [Lentisphaeria bacterium]|nr:YccF family protein [Lentisphaeria bacterium]